MPNAQQHLTKEEYARRLSFKLRCLRIHSGMTQEQVAERAGMASNTYQKYEKGISKDGVPINPRLDSMINLASVFETSVHDLIDVDYDALEPLVIEDDPANDRGRLEDFR